ncbi:pimeloyl-ACP methyl ester carboxylesterase [Streptosporangium becharense]|uniref:Pimeloyl-ACP methyl ester carboxylesterase n=1 Tax=Streptosporangium becharense TaxID=1816182 RepID=A0A7W9IFA5_9ACTN|nr:alpha/beta fold hydrolase [Streptosporangium becharense]MBB2909383.1 pimeloyl-ACP methyl ester carboxylesterase [Streptosporangium becharense]MBB5819660.1 pimeloyl-ACP methyl ester carboxylesterase [Streptosporangium becharense]
MELAFERRGTGSPLVLLHGIGHHWQAWSPVIDRLAAERDVIAVDFPGFGASPPLPPGTPYTAETLADAVESFCAMLGLQAPHVAGNSLGGYVALELAARGAVRTATALSPAGFWNRTELAYARAVLRAARASVRAVPPERAHVAAEHPSGRILSAGLLVAHPSRLPPQALLAALRALRDARGFDATLESLAWLMPPAPPKVPITIAWGRHDRLLLRRQAVRAARWSGQRVKLLAGCGHVPMTDDPELVASVLLEASA